MKRISLAVFAATLSLAGAGFAQDFVQSWTANKLPQTEGKAIYNAICSGCHMPDGKGNQALGAPNLTDNIWVYGASRNAIKESVAVGRQGLMPAHNEFLGDAKSHLVSAYVWSLSNPAK